MPSQLARWSMLLLLIVTSAAARGAQPGQAAAQEPAPKVAATVNGQPITEAELDSAVQRELRGQPVSADVAQHIRKLILDLLIDKRLVEQFLAANNITAEPAKVEQVIQDIKKQVAQVGVPFEQVLKMQGLTEPSLRARIAGELAFQKYVDQQITEEAISQYFAAHKQEYDGTEVRASHILVRLPDNADAQARQKAMAKIQAIRKEITEGLDFAEAAKKYSEGPSGPDGGDIGFFPRHDRIVEPFAAAAFALQEGQVSQPVETRFGLHLIKVTERKAGTKGLQEARGTLREVLARDLWQKTAAEQRKTAKIEIGPAQPAVHHPQ